MPAKIIDGNAIAQQVKDQVKRRCAELAAQHHRVHLSAILVGGTPAGELYAQRQAESCRAVGIDYNLVQLPAETTRADVKREIRRLNSDPSVTGIMMHLPLPSRLDAHRLQYEIDVVKDVEGVNPANIGYVVYARTLIGPCTAMAVMELIRQT